MVNAQDWLDKNYPINERKRTILDISFKNLTGELILVGFSNLTKFFRCYHNNLTKLDLTGCSFLTELYCSYNNLTELNLSNGASLTRLTCDNNNLTNLDFLTQVNPHTLKQLYIRNNNFADNDLTIFSKFTNLERLYIGSDDQEKIDQDIYDRWHGSLAPLQTCTKLARLSVRNTDINSGLEYLPNTLTEFYCATKQRPTALVKQLVEELTVYGELLTDYYGYDNYISLLRQWRQVHPELVATVNQQNLTTPELEAQTQIPPKSN